MGPIQGLKIRSMTDRDFEAIDDVDKRITGRAWAGRVAERASTHFWGYHPDLCFVAEIDGRVIGFVIGNMGGPKFSLPVSGWVNTLGIDPDYQGKGIGLALMKAFVDVCQTNRIPARFIVPPNKQFEKMLVELGFEQGPLVDWVRKSN